MVDTVRVSNVVDGPRNLVVELTNVSDGTGESDVVKIDVSALGPSCETVRIDKIVGSTVGMSVSLYWDATANDLAFSIAADDSGHWDLKPNSLQNPKSTGFTGDLVLSTVGHTAADTYSITLYCTKQGVARG